MRTPSVRGILQHQHIPNSIEYIAERGTRTVLNGSGTTETVTVATNCTAGNTIILLLACRDTSTASISVADSRSNTWTIDVGPNNAGGSGLVLIASTRQNTAQLVAGDTVTVTFGTAPTNRMMLLQEFVGLATSSYLDKTATSSSGTSVGTITSGTTAATTQAKELAVAIFVTSNGSYSSYSYNASGTSGTYKPFNTDHVNANGTNPKSMLACYQILSATGTQVAAVSWASSQSASSAIATYKAAA